MKDDDARLPDDFEVMLRDWPVEEPSATEWDRRSDRLLQRLSEVTPGETPDALLAAPLPAQAGEGSLKAADDSGPRRAVGRAPPAGGLAALARASLEEEKVDDARAIAKQTLSLAKEARARVPESVRESAARLAAARAAVAPATPAPAPRSRAPFTLAGVAIIAVAAVVIVVLLRPSNPLPASPVAVASETTPAAREPSGVGTEAPDPQEEVLSLDDLPPGDGAPPKGSGPRVALKNRAPSTPAAKAQTPSPPTPGEPVEDKDDPRLKPAGKATNVDDKPTAGAIQAAVASVLGGARACVAGHPRPSRATLTFGSNGRVRSVAVSGPAAGTPAEGCIRTALAGARVAPFARESFSASITVRP